MTGDVPRIDGHPAESYSPAGKPIIARIRNRRLTPIFLFWGPTPIDALRFAIDPIAQRHFSFRCSANRIGLMFAIPEFWSALAAIVVIDLVLAGDNAIVIALAARSLPKAVQSRAIVWGTVGAVVVRASLTVALLSLLEIPGLMGAGGVLLVWIAYRLLTGGCGGPRPQGGAGRGVLGGG